jgi:hypothetical protein
MQGDEKRLFLAGLLVHSRLPDNFPVFTAILRRWAFSRNFGLSFQLSFL